MAPKKPLELGFEFGVFRAPVSLDEDTESEKGNDPGDQIESPIGNLNSLKGNPPNR